MGISLVGLLLVAIPTWAAPSPRTFGTTPLYFEPAPDSPNYVGQARGYTLLISSAGAMMRDAGGHLFSFRLHGTRPAAPVQGQEPLPGVTNYLIGNDPSKWRRNIAHYRKVRATPYPGIDVIYYGDGDAIEHDFVVAPGTDPAAILFTLEGAQLDPTGVLRLKTANGEYRQKAPHAYQMIDGRRRQVAARYRQNGQNFEFALGAYDRRYPLIIDPTLVYSTHLGGSSQEEATGMAVDPTGAVYLAGVTTSRDFPGSSLPSGSFVTKLSPNGSELVYSTVFGGPGGNTRVNSIAVDATGNAYLAGTTGPEFPIRNAFQPTYRGNSDLFVSKLNAAGNDFIYSTFLGGSANENNFRNPIRIDSTGAAYLTAVTSSSDFPLRNPFQAFLGGTQDAVIVKLSPAGNELVFSTYLGGAGGDWAQGLVLDGSGGGWVHGTTYSSNFPVIGSNATLNGPNDVYLVQFSPTGQILYSTLYGGPDFENTSGNLERDSAGSLYFTASLSSTGQLVTFSPTTKSFSPLRAAPGYATVAVDSRDNIYLAGTGIVPTLRTMIDVTSPGGSYLMKMDNRGTLSYSTYLGFISDVVAGLSIDSTGAVYLAGSTTTGGYPVHNAYQPFFAGTSDVYLTKIVDTPDNRLVRLSLSAAGAENTDFVVDGRRITGSRTLTFLAGTTHTINTTQIQESGALRRVFTSWSNGGTREQTITVQNDLNLVATFTTYVRLTTESSPAGAGSIVITPAASDGFYPVGQALTVEARPNGGYAFSQWFGIVGGNSNPASLTVANTGAASYVIRASFFSTGIVPTPPRLRFVPLPPCRVVDTRAGEGKTGAFGPPLLAAGSTRDFPLPQSTCGIPTTARAYSLNITVVPSGPLPFLTVWPAGQPRPLVSTLNAQEGQIIANAAIVPAGVAGAISVFAPAATQVVIDINGFFTESIGPETLTYYPVTPCRVVDSRVGLGPGLTLPANTTRSYPISATFGPCPNVVPPTARAYVLNVTAIPHGPLSYITLWPDSAPRPLASTLNSPQSRIVANMAIVPSVTGSISVYPSDPTDLVIDINGYFAPPTSDPGLNLYTITPCRMVDTRSESGFPPLFGLPRLEALQPRTFPALSSACAISADARALSLNLTAVPPGPLIYVTLYPGRGTPPVASTLNALEGQVIANAALMPLVNGELSAVASNPTNLVLDLNGYFAP